MAKTETFKFKATLVVHDPADDKPEVVDHTGFLVLPASKGIRHIAPGTPVELSPKEGQRLTAILGRWLG